MSLHFKGFLKYIRMKKYFHQICLKLKYFQTYL